MVMPTGKGNNRLDKFEKQKKLGEGTYGVVYQAMGKQNSLFFKT